MAETKKSETDEMKETSTEATADKTKESTKNAEQTNDEVKASGTDAVDHGASGCDSVDSKGSEEDKAGETKEDSESKEAAKHFKKNKKEKKDKRDEQIAELNDKVMRQMAEFENFRKRSEKEKSQMFDMGAKSILEKFLPVVDNFERGLATIPEDEKGSAFAVGMENVYKQLMTELEKADVKPIEAVGCELNPDLHNAVMQVQTEEYESGVIAQELMKGYTYKGQVVRHSMVAVAE